MRVEKEQKRKAKAKKPTRTNKTKRVNQVKTQMKTDERVGEKPSKKQNEKNRGLLTKSVVCYKNNDIHKIKDAGRCFTVIM